MTIQFEHPVGAHADVKELEYISALHQTTAEKVRSDGSIQAEDIATSLLSRHRLKVDATYIQHRILSGLVGMDGSTNVMDICELVAVLFIAHLVQAASFKLELEGNNYIYGRVLDLIFADVIGNKYSEGLEEEKAPKLTKDLLVEIMSTCGEYGVPEQVLGERLEAAGGANVEMNETAFARALTNDVHKFDLTWKNQVSTHYKDEMGSYKGSRSTDTGTGSTKAPSKEEAEIYAQGEEDLPDKHVFTAPSIDYTAETYRSQAFFVVTRFALVITYSVYLEGLRSYVRST
jgi:hypothetical protein